MTSTSTARSESVRAIESAMRRYAAASARIDQITAGAVGLTLSTCEANFVNLLRLHGPLTPGQLGKLANFTSSGTTTGVIDRLESAGYVVRERSTTDRRKVIVTLKEDRLAADDEARARRLSHVLAEYTDDQIGTIADFLTRLTGAEVSAASPPEEADEPRR
ncbi:MarR family winged helix-turn-helix transcriptional regulator [Nocardia higoensis]|uniref:MarR family winged helix-turn-helix transcriptional regulator n=1 Tax=Nocardia higoensis TaxID=228599 RepID=UPI000688D110|nr:MarR family transcriptional regulator [Nocardia higoensis]